MRQNLKWVIGNGNSISFRKDIWCGIDPLRDQFVGPLKENWEELKVANFLNLFSCSWDIDKVKEYVPDYLIDRILAIPLASSFSSTDKAFWPSSSEKCSVKEAYSYLTITENNNKT